MPHFFQDLRYALRMLRKSVVDALPLKPLPYPQPDRLALLWLRSLGIGIPQDWPSPGQCIVIKTTNHSFGQIPSSGMYVAARTSRAPEGLANSMLGVFGVISYLVTQGSHDIGIRIALGAPRAGIPGLLMWQAMELAVVGIAAGLAAVALLASYVPARRATRLDPLAALRDE